MKTDSHTDEQLRSIYSLKNIAVVGMSRSEEKAAGYVPRYLLDHGYTIIPVNPSVDQILGRKSYARVSLVPEAVDIVDIFRPSELVAEVVQDALNKPGISVIWMQEGIFNEKAEKMAREKSIDVVYNRCMMAEHMRLFTE